MYYCRYHLQNLKDADNFFKHYTNLDLPTFASDGQNPLIELAMSSMALAVFSRVQKYPPAAREASVKYHQLLRMLQTTIPILDEENIDACLLATFFMGRYENVVCSAHDMEPRSPSAIPLSGLTHHDGALAILKFWHEKLRDVQPATEVMRLTRRLMIKYALLRNSALPEWMEDGGKWGEDGFQLEYDRIIVKLARTRQQLATLLSPERGRTLTTLQELNKVSEDLDTALQSWKADFPSAWHPQRHHLCQPTAGFYSLSVLTYTKLGYAAIWNQFYATRMLVSYTRSRILGLLCQHPDVSDNLILDRYQEQRRECLSLVSSMANDLASSIPFSLLRVQHQQGQQEPAVTSSSNSSTKARPPVSSPHEGDNADHAFPSSSTSPSSSIVSRCLSPKLKESNKDVEPYVTTLIIWPLSIASRIRDVDVELKAWFRSQLGMAGRIIGDSVVQSAEGGSEWWREL